MYEIKDKTTLKSIAEHLDVSATTVSRVLTGQAQKYRISETTAKKVLVVVERLNYRPNQVARSLRLQKTKTLGFMVPDIANPFFGTLARFIEMEARRNGYSIILSDSGRDSDAEEQSLKLMLSKEVDGIIASPVGKTGSYFQDCRKQGKPMVVVDRYFSNLDIPYVTSDNYKASFEAVQYLIDNGHTNIACVQGLSRCLLNHDRIQGYKDAMEANSLHIGEIVGDGFNQRNGYVETKMLLKKKSRPTAIYSLGSSIAFGCFSAITEEGLAVGEDVSLLSFNDEPYFEYLATPVTAVAQQVEEMGQIAVKMVLDQIDSPSQYNTENIKLAASLKIRKSVKKI